MMAGPDSVKNKATKGPTSMREAKALRQRRLEEEKAASAEKKPVSREVRAREKAVTKSQNALLKTEEQIEREKQRERNRKQKEEELKNKRKAREERALIREAQRRQVRKNTGKKIRRAVTVLLLLAIAGAGLFAYFGCRTEKIEVEGNAQFPDNMITLMIEDDPRCDNTLYAFFLYKTRQLAVPPFLERMELSLKGPNTLLLTVKEKKPIGYVTSSGSNMYFDKDGLVLRSIAEKLDGIAEVRGLEIGNCEIYKPLPVKNKDVFKDIIAVGTLCSKYGLPIDTIEIDETRQITLLSGPMIIKLGENRHLEDKIVQIPSVLERIGTEAGTLHLENYEGSGNTITFNKSETKG